MGHDSSFRRFGERVDADESGEKGVVPAKSWAVDVVFAVGPGRYAGGVAKSRSPCTPIRRAARTVDLVVQDIGRVVAEDNLEVYL